MNNAVMREAMTRIGFTEAAARALVEEQGIDNLEEVKLLIDDDFQGPCRSLLIRESLLTNAQRGISSYSHSTSVTRLDSVVM
jgi:hypothetical protein